MKRITALFLSLVLILSAFSVFTASAAGTVTVNIEVKYGQTEARSMLNMINEFRTGSDAWYWNSDNSTKTTLSSLKALKYDYQLEKIAMQRAAEIAVYWAHERPNGSSCFSLYPSGYYSIGENLAAGSTTAAAAFELLQETNYKYDGQGHRRNMLNGSFTAVGIAHVVYNGVHFWVQEFRSPESSLSATPANDTVTSVPVEIDKTKIESANISSSDNNPTTHVGSTINLPVLSASLKINGTWPSRLCPVKFVPDWSIGNTALAKIENGKITGLRAGETTISTPTISGTLTLPLIVTDHKYVQTDIKEYCTESGVITQTCSICSDIITKTVPPTNHPNKYGTKGLSATCTEDGFTGGIYCPDCNEYLSGHETIKAEGHKPIVYSEMVPATCKNDGHTTETRCKVCGETLIRSVVIAKLPHSFTNYVFDNNATCTKDGTKTAKCNSCDETDTIAAPDTAKGHTPIVYSEMVPATCKNDGHTAETRCEVCGETLIRSVVIAKLPHSFTNYVFDNNSTCTKDGTKTAKCNSCDEKDTISAPGTAKGHRAGSPVKENETRGCTAEGSYDEVSYCLDCGEEVFRKTIVTPIVGHDGTITKPHSSATCTQDATTNIYCECGAYVETVAVPGTATGHKPVKKNAVAPTCTEDGKEDDTVCDVCGEIYETGKTIPKTDHKSDGGKVTKKAACTKNGIKTFKCTTCGDTLKTTTIKASGHKEVILKAVTATAKKSGLTQGKKCSICGEILTEQKMTLAQVTGLKSSSEKTTSLKLTWNKIDGAKYYKVEQSTDGKNWKTVKTVNTNEITVSKLTAGKKYQFRVTALDSTKKISGKASATLKTGTLTAAPTVTLKSSKSKTVVVSWKAVTGASKYIVYKSTNGKSWDKGTTTTKTSLTLSKLSGGKKIYVKVVAVNAYSKKSAYSSVKSVTVKK